MSLDPIIREQTYHYFLQEAPELLHVLEQGLLNLRSNWGIAQVNDLMRVTHTLKGAAISIGLDTIAQIAHSLEDIFRALCQPNSLLDPEVEALLFEGLECLRLPLMAELSGSSVDHAAVLNRTAAVFALLQEKLGDCFDQEPSLPTSAELGFDLTQSLFEVGVTQCLEQIATRLNQTDDSEAVAIVLRTQAEVLLGLAESLNLTGFGAIATATIAALNQHPEQALTIAQAALTDFQAGQASVLAGDRAQGGEPSRILQALAATRDSEVPLEASHSLLESIWGAVEDTIAQPPEDSLSTALDKQIFELVSTAPKPPTSPLNSQSQKSASSLSPSVQVSIKHLDQINYAIAELVTNQNRQLLQTEQLQTTSQTLLAQIKHHQHLLAQLQNQQQQQQQAHSLLPSKTTANRSADSSAKSWSQSGRRSKKGRSSKRFASSKEDSVQLIQSLLDHTVQLSETAAAVDLLNTQANQILEKQQQLLSNTQNALIEARMLPIREVFDRFPHMLQQLETLHSKPTTLTLHGNEVLVDKAVAEKLFAPLLHLVRNAFDHGIEPTSVRQQRGKAESGEITLSAYHQGRHLIIEVQDDGNGLDFDQIRQRSIERQLLSIDHATSATEEQLAELLFEPGFSTAAQVSDLSGRGIGLDVVRTQINALRGSVAVRSTPQHGTTFVLQIPLNLTIAQLLVCEGGSKTYALLDDAVEQILIPGSDQIQERNGGRFLRWSQGSDEKLIPIYSLSQVLEYSFPSPVLKLLPLATSNDLVNAIILVRCQDQVLGVAIDRLLGEQKLVIRPLGAILQSPRYVHGATTLADGRLALVIDPATLLQKKIFPDPGRFGDQAVANRSRLSPAPLPLLSHASDAMAPSTKSHVSTRILVVDDSITTRHAIVFVLEKAGYQVFQAQNGQEGLDWFRHHANIQFVICDIEMPKMNGFEFLRHRQQTPDLAAIPVLILSSQSDEKHRLLASQLGATAYMVKPFIEPKLLAIVSTLLDQAPLTAPSES